MLRLTVPALALCALLSACSPTFDWREVRVEPGPLAAMLPCKPDKAARRVPLAGREVELQALGCKAGGASFVLMQADVVEAGRASEALQAWQQATVATLRATSPTRQHQVPPGATDLPGSDRLAARGQQGDGAAVQAEVLFFARGSQVYQAAVYASKATPEMLQTFFESIKLP